MSLLEKITDLISQVNNEAEKEDKRKGIDEIGGILKSAGVDDEIIRTVIKKCEELSYEESEAGTADNKKAKNADDEEIEEEFEEEKEVANKKCKNEEEDKEEDEDKKEVKNKCKNSMDDVKKAIFGGSSKVESGYISKAKRLEMGNKY
jgi:hypothetical protein